MMLDKKVLSNKLTVDKFLPLFKEAVEFVIEVKEIVIVN
jgi:hypothetical protein